MGLGLPHWLLTVASMQIGKTAVLIGQRLRRADRGEFEGPSCAWGALAAGSPGTVDSGGQVRAQLARCF